MVSYSWNIELLALSVISPLWTSSFHNLLDRWILKHWKWEIKFNKLVLQLLGHFVFSCSTSVGFTVSSKVFETFKKDILGAKPLWAQSCCLTPRCQRAVQIKKWVASIQKEKTPWSVQELFAKINRKWDVTSGEKRTVQVEIYLWREPRGNHTVVEKGSDIEKDVGPNGSEERKNSSFFTDGFKSAWALITARQKLCIRIH